MDKVSAIPAGHTTITPFLNIKNAGAAIELYKKAFGAEEVFRQDFEGKVMIAELRIGTGFVRISDAVKESPTVSSNHLLVDNADAWWARAVGAGCTVAIKLETKFWGDRFGVLDDGFGNRWAIVQHVEDVTPEEQRRRAQAMR